MTYFGKINAEHVEMVITGIDVSGTFTDFVVFESVGGSAGLRKLVAELSLQVHVFKKMVVPNLG